MTVTTLNPNPIPAKRPVLRPLWLIGVLAWSGLYIFACSTIFISGVRPLGLILQVVAGLLCPLSLLSPLIFIMAQRFPIHFGTWKINLWKHLLVSAMFALTYASISTAFLVKLQPKVIAAYNEQLALEHPTQTITQSDFPPAAKMFLPPILRSSQFDIPSVLVAAFSSLPSYWVILILAHALFATLSLHEREKHAAELAAHLTQAQLSELRTQLQPHFLFNTLNSIAALIPQNAKLATEMVMNLSDLLRMTLRGPDRAEITFREELALLQHYVDIQRLRFSERLAYHVHVTGDALNAYVPPLLLQPLVENAIRHGLENSDQTEHVTVRGELKAGDLYIEVANTFGVASNGSRVSAESTGVGLANTRSRLRLQFGDKHHFEAGPVAEGGFRVAIRIPARLVERISIPSHEDQNPTRRR